MASLTRSAISSWVEAIAYLDADHPIQALNAFVNIADSARMHFNAGMCAMHVGDCQESITHFTHALECDPCLAAAYMQRGVCNYYAWRVQPALEDFQSAFKVGFFHLVAQIERSNQLCATWA